MMTHRLPLTVAPQSPNRSPHKPHQLLQGVPDTTPTRRRTTFLACMKRIRTGCWSSNSRITLAIIRLVLRRRIILILMLIIIIILPQQPGGSPMIDVLYRVRCLHQPPAGDL